jgi:hypothetical protein
LATALRFHRLEVQSFWNDEGNSARLSERPVALIVEGTASDIHPPLYYLMLRGWRELLGESEFGLRAMSAFLGVGLVAVTYGLSRRILDHRREMLAILAAIFVAINPALIYYSQEARMYELMAFLAALSTLLLIALLQKRRRRAVIALGYTACVAAGLYTHYFFPVVLVVQFLIVVIMVLPALLRRSESWKTPRIQAGLIWLGAIVVAMLIYAPWLPIFWRQAGGRESARGLILTFFADSNLWLSFGSTLALVDALFPLMAFGILLLLGLLALWNRPRRAILISALLLGILVPLLLMWAVGTTQPSFYKFMLMAIPPLSLLAALGIWLGWQEIGSKAFNLFRKLLVILLVATVVWGAGRSLWNMYYDPAYARADYRAMAERIAVEAHPNAGVILNAANQWEVFTYYHQEEGPEALSPSAPVYPIPRSYPDPAAIDAELSEITTQHDRIYALFWGEAERDPERLVERWLDENAFKAGEEWVGDVRFVTYAVPAEPIDEMETSRDVLFGQQIMLSGYSLLSEELIPGEIVQLTLFWQTDAQVDQRYKVFLHLVDENGQIVAQRDSEPGGGLALTNTWRPGEIVKDNHGLLVPAATDPGRYTLLLGLYDISDPTIRLPIETADGLVDALPLAVISVLAE